MKKFPPDGDLIANRTKARVTVLIALWNGGAFLTAQLESLAAQTREVDLIVASDDGSQDNTTEIFAGFTERLTKGQTRLISGPATGGTTNFLHLLAQVGPETDLAALCDQDDVWLPDKLARAAAALAPFADQPALYGARTWEVDAALGHPRLSRNVPVPLNFAHALAQNFAGGNTMVLNRAAIDLVQRCLPGMPEPSVHDWWLYQLIAGSGGTVIFDVEPVLLYRQHDGNQIGAAGGAHAKWTRFVAMLGGTYARWNQQNIAALSHCRAELTTKAAAILDDFAAHRQGTLVQRIAMIRRTGLHRKGAVDHAGLWLAAIVGRL